MTCARTGSKPPKSREFVRRDRAVLRQSGKASKETAMPADPRRVKDLFVAAVELADPDARRALLDRECADDPDLRRRLDILLAAHDQPDSALNQPLATPRTNGIPTVDDTAPPERPGSVVAGRYKLLEAIGEGGMGEVWVADQVEPIRRRVALE